jgi:hypothetical protein
LIKKFKKIEKTDANFLKIFQNLEFRFSIFFIIFGMEDSTPKNHIEGVQQYDPVKATESQLRNLHQDARVGEETTKTAIADHYNARREIGKRKRTESPIFHLKNFNNWVESVLLNKHCKNGDSVLDLAGTCESGFGIEISSGGKAGDLLKFVKLKISHLVLVGKGNGRLGIERYFRCCLSVCPRRQSKIQGTNQCSISCYFCCS